MSNLQLFFAAGLPTITVLLGILLAQRSTDKLERRTDTLEQRMEQRFSRVESRLDRIEADLREFFRTIRQHETRLDTLEKRGA
jgi:hypothetical protein